MVVTDFEAEIDEDRLAMFMGRRKGGRLPSSVERRIDNLTDRVQELTEPQVNFLLAPVHEVKPGQVITDGGVSFKSPKLALTLKDAQDLCVFIATIGFGLDKEIEGLVSQGHYADAYVLDIMASLTVEDVVEQFNGRMAQRFAKEKRAVTLRFSPGYCDWPLQQQAAIFAQVEKSDNLDVEINEAFLMSPSKSVSGIFGVLNSQARIQGGNYNPCDHCPKTDCIARRSTKTTRN
jgi:hypothetical protein